jgi:hypothetical protein
MTLTHRIAARRAWQRPHAIEHDAEDSHAFFHELRTRLTEYAQAADSIDFSRNLLMPTDDHGHCPPARDLLVGVLSVVSEIMSRALLDKAQSQVELPGRNAGTRDAPVPRQKFNSVWHFDARKMGAHLRAHYARLHEQTPQFTDCVITLITLLQFNPEKIPLHFVCRRGQVPQMSKGPFCLQLTRENKGKSKGSGRQLDKRSSKNLREVFRAWSTYLYWLYGVPYKFQIPTCVGTTHRYKRIHEELRYVIYNNRIEFFLCGKAGSELQDFLMLYMTEEIRSVIRHLPNLDEKKRTRRPAKRQDAASRNARYSEFSFCVEAYGAEINGSRTPATRAAPAGA